MVAGRFNCRNALKEAGVSQYVMEQAVTRGRIVDAPTAQVLSSL